MRLHVIKHVPFEGPGLILDWARARGHTVALTELSQAQPLPRAEGLDWLVLMGGPMSVNDEAHYPWLAPEKALVRECAGRGQRVLGVCLGAQLIASALGSPVASNGQREIGFFPVERVPGAEGHPLLQGLPPRFTPLHWHGETFALPPGAAWLHRSEACAHQSFALGKRVLGLQYHLECQSQGLAALLQHCANELEPGQRWVQDADTLGRQAADALGALRTVCEGLLERMEAV